MKFSVLFLVTIFSLGTACSQIPDFGGAIMNSVEELKSDHSSNYPVEGKITKTVTSEQVFKMEWEKVHEGMSPIPERPIVNFEERFVILVMLETKPTGGFGFDEFRVHENADQYVVFYSEAHPGDGCFTTQALTRPYKFISVPNTDKEVEFVKGDTVFNHCNE
ncbi:MAG: protease complex subunit PrcB family protein [Gracilimonas sp.]